MNESAFLSAHAPQPSAGRKEAQIVCAARSAFLDHGFADTSMEAIARARECVEGDPLRLFPQQGSAVRPFDRE